MAQATGARRPPSSSGPPSCHTSSASSLSSRLPWLAGFVNRTFRRVEKVADWLIGSAGPVFVTLCILLVSIGAWTFFVLFLPTAVPPKPVSHGLSSLAFPFVLSSCLFVIYAIGWSYHSACVVRPGFVPSFSLEASRLARDDIGGIERRWDVYASRARSESTQTVNQSGRAQDLADPDVAAADENSSEEDSDSDDHWPRVKMCYKCPPVPLWKALAMLPPELRQVEKEKRLSSNSASQQDRDGGVDYDSNNGDEDGARQDKAPANATTRQRLIGLTAQEEEALWTSLRESILTWLPSKAANSLVPPPKPERTHHCSVCKFCVIKYDHHCPWLNQCVGLDNERYFVLFLFWLVIGCLIVLACGASQFYAAVKLLVPFHPQDQGQTLLSFLPVPRAFVLITYVLSFVMGGALAAMGGGHIYMISKGETSVESSDRSHYQRLAQRRRLKFVNVYDLGARRNLELFFNIDEKHRGWAAWTRALAPRRGKGAYADGWHWAKRKGLGGVHAGIQEEEELTDDEVDHSVEGEAAVVAPREGSTTTTAGGIVSVGGGGGDDRGGGDREVSASLSRKRSGNSGAKSVPLE